MTLKKTAPLGAAFIAALSMTAFAQSQVPGVQPPTQLPPAPPTVIPPPDTPTTAPSSTPRSNSSADEARDAVTVMGCIEREADYRAARDQGKGGPAGSGAGVGNEYILTHATTGAPVATSGSGSTESLAYQLTGSAEGDAGQFLKQRVELTGHFKTSEMNAKDSSKGSSDLKLREFEVRSVRASSGTCN